MPNGVRYDDIWIPVDRLVFVLRVCVVDTLLNRVHEIHV